MMAFTEVLRLIRTIIERMGGNPDEAERVACDVDARLRKAASDRMREARRNAIARADRSRTDR